jgi:hypothetical protein
VCAAGRLRGWGAGGLGGCGGQEQHEDLEGLGQEHHGGFAEDEGGERDGSAAGSTSRRRWFRRSHVVAPPIAPHTDNRVVIIPCGDR